MAEDRKKIKPSAIALLAPLEVFGRWTWNIPNIQKLDVNVFCCGFHCQCCPDRVCARSLLSVNPWTGFSRVTCRCWEPQEERVCGVSQRHVAAVGKRGPMARRGEGEPDGGGVWRREEEEGGNGSSWDLEPALCSCRSGCYWVWVYACSALLGAGFTQLLRVFCRLPSCWRRVPCSPAFTSGVRSAPLLLSVLPGCKVLTRSFRWVPASSASLSLWAALGSAFLSRPAARVAALQTK